MRSGNAFQKIVQRNITHDDVFNISDGIIAHATTQNEHLQQLRKVFDKIREKVLKLNVKKCKFCKSSVNYMGHNLSSEGLFLEPEKVNLILQLQPPPNTSEDAETRYSQTEREALAVLFSCKGFKNYVYGLRFTIVTDQKPLLKLYSPSCLEPPTRIHSCSLRLEEFDSKLECEAGLNNIADILSRKPFFDPPNINEAAHFVSYVVSKSIPKTMTFHKIREATQNDQILAKVCDTINNNQWRFYKNDIHLKP